MLREAAVVMPACHAIIRAWVERKEPGDDRDKATGPRGLGAKTARLKTMVGDTGPRTKCGERRNKDRGPRLHARLCWGSACMAGQQSREPDAGLDIPEFRLRPAAARSLRALGPCPVGPSRGPVGSFPGLVPSADALGPSAGLVPAPIPAPVSADQAKTCKAWIVPSSGR